MMSMSGSSFKFNKILRISTIKEENKNCNKWAKRTISDKNKNVGQRIVH